MIPFAVWHEGIEEGQGRWVLAVQGERLLLANEGKLYWKRMDACRFISYVDPSTPKPVFAVQPQQVARGNGIVVPGPGDLGMRN